MSGIPQLLAPAPAIAHDNLTPNDDFRSLTSFEDA